MYQGKNYGHTTACVYLFKYIPQLRRLAGGGDGGGGGVVLSITVGSKICPGGGGCDPLWGPVQESMGIPPQKT